jgi:hypothetical protein
MNLSDQVCSLELAKRLKELGVQQESLFIWSERYWTKNNINEKNEIRSYLTFNPSTFHSESIAEYSAFTVAELLDLIPRIIDIKKNEPFNLFRFILKKTFIVEGNMLNLIAKTQYLVNFECDSTELEGQDAWLRRLLVGYSEFADENCANALAKILIHLIEQEIIKYE